MVANINPDIIAPNVHNLSLRIFLERDRLNHNNFMDWYRNLRIVLNSEKRSYVLGDPIPDEPSVYDEEAYVEWIRYTEDSIQVSRLMMGTYSRNSKMF